MDNQNQPALSWGDYMLLQNISVPYFTLRSLEIKPPYQKATDDTGFCPNSCIATEPQACITSAHFRLTKNGWLSWEYSLVPGKNTVRIQSPLVATLSIGMVSGSWSFCVQQKLAQLELSWPWHMPTASLLHDWGYPREGSANEIRAFLLEKSGPENRNMVLSQKSMLHDYWSTSQCCGFVLHPLMTSE